MDTAAVVDDSGLGLVAQWAISLMEFLREPGAGVAIALENLYPPIPSEVILPLAGFVASQGTLNIWLTILWTTLGSIVGAMALYGLGAWLGLPRLRAIADRLPGMRVDHIDRTVDWFERNGGKAVFLGRFLPLFRSLISIPAGIVRMSIPLFLMLTAAGSLIWNTIFIVAGYVLGEQWKLVEEYAGWLDVVLIGVLCVWIVWFLSRRAAALWQLARRSGRLWVAERRRALSPVRAWRRRHPAWSRGLGVLGGVACVAAGGVLLARPLTATVVATVCVGVFGVLWAVLYAAGALSRGDHERLGRRWQRVVLRVAVITLGVVIAALVAVFFEGATAVLPRVTAVLCASAMVVWASWSWMRRVEVLRVVVRMLWATSAIVIGLLLWWWPDLGVIVFGWCVALGLIAVGMWDLWRIVRARPAARTYPRRR